MLRIAFTCVRDRTTESTEPPRCAETTYLVTLLAPTELTEPGCHTAGFTKTIQVVVVHLHGDYLPAGSMLNTANEMGSYPKDVVRSVQRVLGSSRTSLAIKPASSQRLVGVHDWITAESTLLRQLPAVEPVARSPSAITGPRFPSPPRRGCDQPRHAADPPHMSRMAHLNSGVAMTLNSGGQNQWRLRPLADRTSHSCLET